MTEEKKPTVGSLVRLKEAGAAGIPYRVRSIDDSGDLHVVVQSSGLDFAMRLKPADVEIVDDPAAEKDEAGLLLETAAEAGFRAERARRVALERELESNRRLYEELAARHAESLRSSFSADAYRAACDSRAAWKKRAEEAEAQMDAIRDLIRARK